MSGLRWMPKMRQTVGLDGAAVKRRDHRISALIAEDGRLDGGGPGPQRSRYVCLRYKNGRFVSSRLLRGFL